MTSCRLRKRRMEQSSNKETNLDSSVEVELLTMNDSRVCHCKSCLGSEWKSICLFVGISDHVIMPV